jgi:hypothetical protein
MRDLLQMTTVLLKKRKKRRRMRSWRMNWSQSRSNGNHLRHLHIFPVKLAHDCLPTLCMTAAMRTITEPFSLLRLSTGQLLRSSKSGRNSHANLPLPPLSWVNVVLRGLLLT